MIRLESVRGVRRREHKWGLVAIIASVSVHLAFGAYVATHSVPPPEVKTVETEFIFDPTPEIPAPRNAPEAPKPPPPPKVALVQPPPREPKPTRPVNDVPRVERPVVDDVPRVKDVPTAPLNDVPMVNAALIPNSTVVLRLDAGVPGQDVEVVTGKLSALDAPKAGEMVKSLTKETLGRGRVDRGLVHPYYSQLGKSLLKNWDAERVAKEGGLSGFFEQGKENLQEYNKIWLEKAAQYGSSGNPLGDTTLSNNRRAVANERIQGLNGADLEQRKEMSRAMKEQFKSTKRAVIRVVQNRQGKLIKVELVQPSKDEKVDQEALQDVKSAAEKLPPPPDEAMEGRETLSSLWSFELVVSISPPVPSFTFEFDEALGYIDARLPLDRRIYKKVRLVSVE